MKERRVSDLMVPLSEYATVSMDATLEEAVMTLERAQQDFDQTRYRHRAILIYDHNDQIVGKVSQNDILRALEPKYRNVLDDTSIQRFGFTRQFLHGMMDQFGLWKASMEEICKKGANIKVKEFMYTPHDGEYVEDTATLDVAIHQLVMGHHQSLLVMKSPENTEIVGILRLTDVFMAVFETIASCKR